MRMILIQGKTGVGSGSILRWASCVFSYVLGRMPESVSEAMACGSQKNGILLYYYYFGTWIVSFGSLLSSEPYIFIHLFTHSFTHWLTHSLTTPLSSDQLYGDDISCSCVHQCRRAEHHRSVISSKVSNDEWVSEWVRECALLCVCVCVSDNTFSLLFLTVMIAMLMVSHL
jgi:hypothetical protein